MAIPKLDKTKPGTSGYWLDRLGGILDARAKTGQAKPTMQMYRDYYNGDQRLAFATEKFRQIFGSLFSGYNENICGVVVNTLVERLTVIGLRMGQAAKDSDQVAWRMWQENELDARMAIGFHEAATCGEVNLLVGPNPDNGALPLITVEDPLETVVVTQGRRRIAGLKRWYEADRGRWRAFVYYPDRIEKFWGPEKADQTQPGRAWSVQDIAGEDAELPHTLGLVPLIPMAHRPNLAGIGISELSEVLPIQDAINKLAADMIVASEFGAFRQRWATGIEIPVGEDGRPVDTFEAAINRLWIGNPPDDADPTTEARFGEFGQTDLAGYISAIKQRLQMAATIKRMPPHYLLGEPGQLPSGESISASESGLVAKAIDCSRDYDQPIEEAFRVAFKVIGDADRAAIRDSQVMWRDPRFRTESEHIDALAKLKALGIPDEILWEEVPYTPQQIARIKGARLAAAQEMAAAFDPAAATNVAPPTTEQLEKRVAMLDELIRAGWTPDSAAEFLGISELQHTGRLPVTVQAA